jgi:hypothetical protein
MGTTIGIVLYPDNEELDWVGPFEVFGMAASKKPRGDSALEDPPPLYGRPQTQAPCHVRPRRYAVCLHCSFGTVCCNR